jgi:alpha-mannosidase
LRQPIARLVILAVTVVAALATAGPTPGTEPPAPTLYTVATSHLDTQWRWTIQETIDEYLLATLDDNFALLETYPEYVFSFEGAFRYQLIQEYYPARFERMREYIAQGRWRVCGSWLDAVDVNMPSPEALFRHTLYGNGYFDREFGVRSVDVFLPDCFGFGYALPSIMAHSGLTGFSTQKLSWGCAFGTPFDIGRWRGVDGREVLAAVNPGAYVSDIETDLSRDPDVQAAIDRTVTAGGPPVAHKYFGTGDTGGAPSAGSVAKLGESMQAGGPVRVLSAGADQIFRDITADQAAGLPLYDGELVMTSHGAGCYTSQAAMKRWNRRCEVLADAAERAAVLAWWQGVRDYPHAELERAWTRFLWHGFHDDLTGTSIPEAYTFSWNDMLLSQQEFAQVLRSSIEALTPVLDTAVQGEPLLVLNPLGHARDDVVSVILDDASGQRLAVFGPRGQAVACQQELLDDGTGRVRLSFQAPVAPLSVSVFDLRRVPLAGTQPDAAVWDADTGVLETARYRLRLGEDGLTSLLDKQTGRELLAAPPQLQLLFNEPEKWAAWEVDHDEIMAEPYAQAPLGGVPVAVHIGPTGARLEFRQEAAGSVFRQTLTVAGDRLDWDLDIDWATPATLLKAAFFTTARDTQATYDLGLGAIARGLNRPLLYEVPAQRWADVTDRSGEFGLTVMNDGRHGWDLPAEGVLRLSLLHTPAVNDHWRWIDDQKSQDLGRHRVTVSLMGHGADWRTSAVREADELNQPLLVFAGADRRLGARGRELSLLNLSSPDGPGNRQVAVRAVKKAERSDHLVVRLQEVSGEAARGVTLSLAGAVSSVDEWRADETPAPRGRDLRQRADRVSLNLAPYQPRTLALNLRRQPAATAGTHRPLDLPWNADIISTDDDPADGDLDGTGCSLPDRLVPAVIERDGVRFPTGPREAGAANAVRCEGQHLDLPAADDVMVQLLVCATDGSREAAFTLPSGATANHWIPDGRRWFGQWDSRVVGEDIVHDAAQVTPGYVNEGDIGWVVTHRHDADGRKEPYVFTHFYRVTVDPGPPTGARRRLRLPDDPEVLVLSAALVGRGPRLTALNELVDRPARPSVTLLMERRAFIDSVAVSVDSPDRGVSIALALDGAEPEPWTGTPLVIRDTAELTVTATAPGRDATVRQVSFTRMEPWPATAMTDPRPGLHTALYLGAWEALPDWAALEAAGDTVMTAVVIPPQLPDEDIGAVFTGALVAPATGVYRFWLSSDDGSRLSIGGREVIDHDGLHGSAAVWAEAPLAAGHHPVVVEFFQHLGGRDLKLEWSGPGFGRCPVPAEALVHDPAGKDAP